MWLFLCMYVCIIIIVFFSTLLTVFLTGGYVRQTGHSVSKYLKAKSALNTVFGLLYRVPLIDVGSIKGIALVCLHNNSLSKYNYRYNLKLCMCNKCICLTTTWFFICITCLYSLCMCNGTYSISKS